MEISIDIFHTMDCQFRRIGRVQISGRDNYVCINIITVFNYFTMCIFHFITISYYLNIPKKTQAFFDINLISQIIILQGKKSFP